MAILRLLIVAFSFIVEQLKRLAAAAHVGRHPSLATAGLMLAAFVALFVWGSERSAQRISLVELSNGGLAPMQSWIIVSGELRAEESQGPGFRYLLTDPGAPNAKMSVNSPVELPLGQTTISGTFLGPREPMPPGQIWDGQIRADAIVAQEQAPPWLALVLAAAGLLVVVGGRISYPMFFHDRPQATVPRTKTLRVGVRRRAAPATLIPGTLRLDPGGPLELSVSDTNGPPLRIYAGLISVAFGELRGLTTSEPVLRVHLAAGDLDVIFASLDDRAAAFAAMFAQRQELAARRNARAPREGKHRA